MFLYTWDIKKGTVMPDLRIKPNIENGDLPEQMELFDGEKYSVLDFDNDEQEPGDNFLNLVDIFNPLKMKEALDKASRSKK